MSTITKERIELFIKNPLENGLTRGEQMELARIALASLEAAEKRIAELEARAFNPAILDVIAERQRQQSVEGWMPEHDDEHCNGELAMAAVCYINETGTVNRNGGKPWGWPWDASWWKPNARRRNLVKAGALILAEIERIDRAAMLQAEPVSNSDELPLDYLQGHKDGLEWAAQLAEANHPQTGDWLYDDPIDLARAIRKGPDMPTVQAGNSPVTPDGWIPVSKRMPEPYEYVLVTDGFDGCEVMRVNTDGYWGPTKSLYPGGITHWMPLPEPPQEVNRG